MPSELPGAGRTPPYHIGIASGPSGLVVVDLDTPKDADDLPPAEWSRPGIRNGLGVLLALWERHDPDMLGQLVTCEPFDGYCEMAPAAHIVKTPSGGIHLYYAAPNGTERRNTVRSAGSAVRSQRSCTATQSAMYRQTTSSSGSHSATSCRTSDGSTGQ